MAEWKRRGAVSVNNKQAHLMASVQDMTKSNDDQVCICITHNVPVESTPRTFEREFFKLFLFHFENFGDASISVST